MKFTRDERVMRDAANNVNRDWGVDKKRVSNKTLSEYKGVNEIDRDTPTYTTPSDRVSSTLSLICKFRIDIVEHPAFCDRCSRKYLRRVRSFECDCE